MKNHEKLVSDLGQLMQIHAHSYNGCDFNHLLEQLALQYHIAPRKLLHQGFSKAYRQLVEGIV
ncbi:MAG: hypothetical protein HQM11_01595 [SAR324 cluster bacterium]|nr:hypothetical protein [SAR324 cluster bacterium]